MKKILRLSEKCFERLSFTKKKEYRECEKLGLLVNEFSDECWNCSAPTETRQGLPVTNFCEDSSNCYY